MKAAVFDDSHAVPYYHKELYDLLCQQYVYNERRSK